MPFELLENKQVMEVTEVLSERQPNGKAIIKTHYGMLEKIVIVSDKTTVALNEIVNITLTWQLFDLQAGQYFNNRTNIQPFKVNIAGEVHEVTPIDGEATIQFSSAIAGEFEIGTVNPNVDNASIKVVVQDATS